MFIIIRFTVPRWRSLHHLSNYILARTLRALIYAQKNGNTIDNAAALNLIVHINDTIAQTLITTEKTGFHALTFYAIRIIACMDFLTHHSKINP